MTACVQVQFMVLYQLILSFIFSIAYFMDGSTMSYRQVKRGAE